ncbi:Slo-interacting protein 1 [Aphelenchoides fujianensis]|nr:Slo-interacting protein 1 [Aphelenchoides fujianensis]
MGSKFTPEALERLHDLLFEYLQQLENEEEVNYHPVEPAVHEPMSPSSCRPAEELRCVATQTDPLTEEEVDALMLEEEEEEEDIYEEIATPVGNMERLLLLNEPIDYEEVELRRSASCQRLGLTLCYGGADDRDTDIFVSQLEKGSVAERNGRVRVGDQILQVNGADVRNREEAMRQFALESQRVLLLLARPSNEQGAEDEEEQVLMEEPPVHSKLTLGVLPEHDDSADNSAAHEHEKDSGLSRTTDSDSEHPAAVQTPVADGDRPNGRTRASMERNFERELAHLQNEMENIRLECARMMGRKEAANNQQAANQQAEQASSLMRMIERLSQHTTSVAVPPPAQSHAQKHVEKRTKGTETPPLTASVVQPRSLNILVNRPPPLTPRSARKHLYEETTSSAYNTGNDSCRSTPNKNEQLGHPSPPRPVHLTVKQKRLDLGALSSAASEHAYHTIETPVAPTPPSQFRLPRFVVPAPPPPPQQPPPEFRRPRLQHQAAQPVQPQAPPYIQPGQTLYTTPDRLAETIAFQQRLLRQALGGDPRLHTLRPTTSNANASTVAPTDTHVDYHTVKRRPDGTRYVTRRPVRAQLLKAREEQLNRERTGLSTDDDAGSELKTGKFWTRQQRKEHLERQREKKQRRHELLSAKQAAGAPERLIQELSHRKQMRRRGQQFFDTYTTLQEMLIHGARDPSLRPTGGILSVTTV